MCLRVFLLASGANAFDNVFCFFGLETGGEGDGGYVDTCEAVGAVAEAAGEVDVAVAVARVVEVADAVFLRTATVVNLVEKVGVGQGLEVAEEGGAVNGGQVLLKVGEAEGVGQFVAHFAPYH